MADRYFIEHGMIHDPVTGRHITTEADDDFASMNCGIQDALDRLNAYERATEIVYPTKEALCELVHQTFYTGGISGASMRLADAFLEYMRDLNKRVDTATPDA